MKKTKNVLLRLYYIFFLGGSVVIGLFLLYSDMLHYHFSFQYIPGFFAIYGFIYCAILILGAKLLGLLLERREDYYEKRRRR
ncbi:MAG: hypothetical protein AB1480_01440 [Nitrospirota bacterium]